MPGEPALTDDGRLPDDLLRRIAVAAHDRECQCGGKTHPNPVQIRRLWISAAEEVLLHIAYHEMVDHERQQLIHIAAMVDTIDELLTALGATPKKADTEGDGVVTNPPT